MPRLPMEMDEGNKPIHTTVTPERSPAPWPQKSQSGNDASTAIAIHGPSADELAEAIRRVDSNMSVANVLSPSVDLILLTIDGADMTNGGIQETIQLLHQHEFARCFERLPGGFPVGFVLTKCDTLLERGDTVPRWLARVEQIRLQLAHSVRSQLTAFGRIEPFVAATATRCPAIAGAPVDESGGLGLVSLVYQIHEKTRRHRKEFSRSRKRLILQASFAIAAIVLLVVMAGQRSSGMVLSRMIA